MSSDSIPLYVIILIIALCVLNALISASKRALDTVDRNIIKDMFDDEPDNKKIANVMNLLKQSSKYHYADLFASYTILVAAFALFEFKIASCFELKYHIIALVLFLFIYTAVAELFPKKLGSQSSESMSISLSGFQMFIYYITIPFVKIIVGIANLLLIICRKKTDVDDVYFSEDKVMSMLDRGQETGDIKEEGRKMIDSVFEFDDLLAYEIMTPRTDVFMIDIDDDHEEYIEELMELTYSRIPVYRDDADNIIGILHIKDYLHSATKNGFDNVDIESILREPYFVPETKNIDSLFYELQKGKQHLALLIDEYGGFSGLVSIEDIIEQIFGDIDDEFDEDDRVIEKISDTEYIVDGNVYLDDLDEETGIELESETSETIGGFIIDLMGEIPKEDTAYQPIRYDEYSFIIKQVKDRRIEKVQIIIHDDEESDSEDR